MTGRAAQPRGATANARMARASAEVLQRLDARAAAARRVQAKAAGLQLTGALSERRDDEWLQGEPTAEQKRQVEALRASFQVRAREATDNRRLATALDWWAEFLTFAKRLPF
eukprot:4258091-Pleurochrysis_carterae.AAC.1